MSQYGLYIHIPFCKSKCYYCDFYSVLKNDEDMITKYISAMEQEILFFCSKYNLYQPEIVTLYIGGGTPSLLNEREILNLFNIITKYYNFYNLCEVNIEVNPESVNKNQIILLADIVNRINPSIKLRVSLGVQSFNNKILKSLGRRHQVHHVYNAVEIFEKVNIYNYNFDIIFGCPGQTLKDVVEDIKKAIELNPTHISCYALTVTRGTRLYVQNFTPDEELQARMYEKIVNLLQTNGYYSYEISNFSKKGFECLHNLNYWLYKEYIGIGSSSVSFLNSQRIKNISCVEKYVNNKYNYHIEVINETTKLKEQIILGLRTNAGLPETSPAVKKFADIFESLLNKGLLIKHNNYIKISPEYRFVSNSILAEFM